jgi:hypothetical protein
MHSEIPPHNSQESSRTHCSWSVLSHDVSDFLADPTHPQPDPLGVLDEDEIFFASGQTLLEDVSGLKKHCIVGPVIVSFCPATFIST